tara:strand:+ start:5019 stop:5243 length:225 start_codon:yes stop_codon:yes gene_type:complete
MSSMFGSTKYRETASDKQLRLDIEARRKEEEQTKLDDEKKRKHKKSRRKKGLIGSRSMFTRAGGRGYETDGEET